MQVKSGVSISIKTGESNMNRTVVLSLLAGIAAMMLAGCQESESGQIQRARLVGSENLKLKKQLEEKDQQIAQLQDQIEQLKAESEKAAQDATNAYLTILETFTQTEQNNEKLIRENETLKEELEKLKAQ